MSKRNRLTAWNLSSLKGEKVETFSFKYIIFTLLRSS